jgi:hypothetical protein
VWKVDTARTPNTYIVPITGSEPLFMRRSLASAAELAVPRRRSATAWRDHVGVRIYVERTIMHSGSQATPECAGYQQLIMSLSFYA